MIPSITPQKLRFTAFSGLIGLLLVSCGSYEQASYYDNDGIYSGGTERVVVTESRNPQPAARQDGDDFYQNYFGEKSQELDRYLESEVFTDVDAYTSAQARDSLAADSLGVEMGNYYQDYNNDYAGQPGWGDSANNVSINLYGGFGTGWGAGWGWGTGWGYPGWGYGWGWGWPMPYYRWGWGDPGWGWGWGAGWGWGWGAGWGWGYPGWGWGPGWGYPGWGWGYPYYRNAGYAYGRRGYYGRYSNINALGARSVMAANTRNVRTNSGRSNRDFSSGRYASARSNQNRTAAARNARYRSSRSTRTAARYGSNSRSARTYTGVSRSARPRAYQGSTSRSRQPGTYRSGRSGSSRNIYSRTGRTYRSSGSSRTYGPSSRSGGTYRSSGSRSSRSSGSYRSSGGSRSSGSMRSSGGGSRSSGGRSSGGRSGGRGGRG